MKKKIIAWTRDYINSFGPSTKVIVGISGGKDSAVAAKICVEALGANRVIGVLLPDDDNDIVDALRIVRKLGITYHKIDISLLLIYIRNLLKDDFPNNGNWDNLNSNLPSRIRMTILYSYAALYGDCRVVNTTNKSELYVGYTTKFGDSVGDFALFRDLLSSDVVNLGIDLGLPQDIMYKIPSDGMSGISDEEKLGISYKDINRFLNGKDVDKEIIEKIEYYHNNNKHKFEEIPYFRKDD